MPPNDIMLTSEEWEKKYQPVAIDGSEVWEYRDTLAFDVHQVWTLIDGDEDDNTYVVNGYHLVNKWGYTVTKVPWGPDNALIQAIWSEANEE